MEDGEGRTHQYAPATALSIPGGFPVSRKTHRFAAMEIPL